MPDTQSCVPGYAEYKPERKVIATLQKAEDYILHLKEQHHQHLLEATNRQ